MSLVEKRSVWQTDLIDMSRMNKLLYFSSMGRAPNLQLLMEPESVFGRLQDGRGSLVLNVRNTIPLDLVESERKLSRLRTRAREALNDRGTHVLFVALGILEWREAQTSQELIRSPLVLIPVALTRDGLLGSFRLARTADEDVTINPTLAEKLRNDFRLELPTYAEIEADLTERAASFNAVAGQPARVSRTTLGLNLSDVIDRIRQRIPSHLDWQIVDEVYLGIFSFQKLVMYQDLQRNDEAVLNHPLLKVIGGDIPMVAEPAGLPSARELDRKLRPHDSLEILDADSSQQEAIVAAKAGASFVLQGPPGTGKSQTIANIIAESLALGRWVLFVSEKRAALEVVQQRLHEAGIAEFCLDLHSQKVNKKDFIAELHDALADTVVARARSDVEARWTRESEALQQSRDRLNAYVRALHTPHAPLQRSAFQAYGELARLEAVPDLACQIPHVEQVTYVQLQEMLHALNTLLNSHDVLTEYATYPWRETLKTEYTLQLGADVRASFGRMRDELDRLDEHLTAMQALLGEADALRTFGWAAAALRRAEHALRTPLPPVQWFHYETTERLRELGASASRRCAQYIDDQAAFEPLYRSTAKDLDHATLLSALTEEAAWALGCLNSTPDVAHDWAITARDELDARLDDGCRTLDALTTTAQSVAQALQQPEPRSLQEVYELGVLADCVLSTPNPPASWLEINAFSEVRVVALDTAARYAECARSRQALEARYAPAFFEQDLVALAARFVSEYGTLLRFVHPAYYADLKQVRSMLLPGQVRTPDDVRKDVLQAAKLIRDEESLRSRLPEHARILGHVFNGAKTDWTQLESAVTWTSVLHAHVGAGGMPAEVARLVTGPARGLNDLRAVRTQFVELEEQWRTAQHFVAVTVRLRALIPHATRLNSVVLDPLRTELRRLLASLRDYWSAIDTMREHQKVSAGAGTHAGGMRSWAELCADVQRAQRLYAFERWLEENGTALARDFGHFYSGVTTDWSTIADALDWTETLLRMYPDRRVPEAVMQVVPSGSDERAPAALADAVQSVKERLGELEREWAFSDTILPRTALLPARRRQDDTEILTMREQVAWYLDQLPCFERWIECNRRLEYCTQLGLGSVLDAALRQQPFPEELLAVFEKRFWQAWLDAVAHKVPALANFHGDTHAQIAERFRLLDADHVQLARRRLREQLIQHRYAALWDERYSTNSAYVEALQRLRHEVMKKRHASIRQIVRATAPALLALKPCWMMSPLSVSQFVESADRLFDLVVFDEASQVCPEDAMCAILRGKQLIVVGDSKQLPPTRFFTKTLADEADEDDDDGLLPHAGDERTESILDECRASSFRERSLLWHYRSRHESLIAFSNVHFYAGKLHTFPGPQAEHGDGVRFEYVANGRYDRSGSRQNVIEAERVVDLIFDHMREHRQRDEGRSLGVVALSEAQQRAIDEALERRFKHQPELRTFEDELNEDSIDGFFIKNLESVQGDERDVIILSVGYGRDAAGVVHKNFGPVNRKGGERRLNVAVTRAKDRLILVSSIRSGDLTGDLTSLGARTLRDYLEYAERGPGVLEQQRTTSAEHGYEHRFESPFEEAVFETLTAKGLQLNTQVGCSGYRIDMAVRDPRRPDSYLLGIECDGATYHSSATARDRDRLRQRHLERMGWHIHRIWSRDWVRNPTAEVTRVLQALEEAEATMPTPVPEVTPVSASASVIDVRDASSRQATVQMEDSADDVSDSQTATSSLPDVIPVPVSSSLSHTGRAHSARLGSPQPSSGRICETCSFYQEQTATRFYCGRDATSKARDATGRTTACPAWKRSPA